MEQLVRTLIKEKDYIIPPAENDGLTQGMDGKIHNGKGVERAKGDVINHNNNENYQKEVSMENCEGSEQKETTHQEFKKEPGKIGKQENVKNQGDEPLKTEDHIALRNSEVQGNGETKKDQDSIEKQRRKEASPEIENENTTTTSTTIITTIVTTTEITTSTSADNNTVTTITKTSTTSSTTIEPSDALSEKDRDDEKKHLRVLNEFRSKMKKYQRSLTVDGNVIDFETIFADEVKKRNVVLEDILVSGREVSFLIAVSCHETNPKVTVRYTTDFWESVLNEEAKPFHAGNDDDDDKLFQRFFLTLSVPIAECLEFALRCMGDLGTFWDNNNYSNFKVESVMENGSPGDLTAKFTPLKECMFDDMVKRRPVMLKNASLKDGKVVLSISTKESSTDLPGIRYTLDNWKSFRDVTSVESKGQDAGRNVSEILLDIPKETKMIFAVFWRHGGIEYWDNNNRRDFEIQA